MKKVLDAIREALKALEQSKATGPRAESIFAHLKSCESNAAAEVGEKPKPVEASKEEGGFGLLSLLILVSVIGLMLVAAVSARAQDASFNLTNRIDPTTIVVSWPTNTVGTNSIGNLTGSAIDIRNYQDGVGFVVSGTGSAAGTATTDFKLVRSAKNSPPSTAYDWETTSQLSLSATLAGTGYIYWYTNLPPEWMRGANYIGLFQVTNNNSSAIFYVTNCGVTKKMKTIRYP